MREILCEQGTAQWLEARHGKITASRIKDVLDHIKTGEGAKRRNYRIEQMAERLSGRSEDHYTSPEMMWGTEMEPYARAAYEVESGNMVDQVGFVLHPTFDFAGASPDGLIGQHGCFEAKCPKTTTHLKWMMAGIVPEEHQDQCLWVMRCAGREWCDFVSYDPRLPKGLKLFTQRLMRDEERIQKIEAAVIAFNDEIEAALAPLRALVIPETKPVEDTRSAYEQVYEMIGELIP
jgi:putative phage-type endonuclease